MECAVECEHDPNGSPRPDAIEARGLNKFYGRVHALRHVDFSLAWGEVHALVGDNGAGKSTLVKLLSGALSPDEGEVSVDGVAQVLGNPLAARHLGIETVYQDLALIDTRTIHANLFLGRELTSRFGLLRRRAMRDAARQALADLGAVEVPNVETAVQQLSGGQRQLLAIARAVGFGARILLLDEPTAALGVQESGQILDVVTKLRTKERAILLISHNLAHVFRLADRITVMRGGTRVGTVEKDKTDPDGVVKMITGVKNIAGGEVIL
jgi:ABC-type sugar transport system ATPase subunit